jgi:transcription termination factor Rho
MYDIIELNQKLVTDLREIAKELQIKKTEKLKKQELVYKILDTQAILASEGKLKQIKPATQNPQVNHSVEKKSEDDSIFKRKRMRITRMKDEKVQILSKETPTVQLEKESEPAPQSKSEDSYKQPFNDDKRQNERKNIPNFRHRSENNQQPRKNFNQPVREDNSNTGFRKADRKSVV